MSLSNDLISQFVKATKNDTKAKTESTVYGTVVEKDGSLYVQIDGSDSLTPISKTTNVGAGERVTVLIKNHTAIVTGNVTNPSARVITKEDGTKTVEDLDIGGLIKKVNEFETVIADVVRTDVLAAETGRIETLLSNHIIANDAVFDELRASDATITGELSANKASIESLKTSKLDAEVADMKYATIESLDATNANIYNLSAVHSEFVTTTTNKLTAIDGVINTLDSTYATIADLDVERGKITDLMSEVAEIDTLIFGSASGNVIQTSFANSVIAQLGDAQIKSAMIESVSADKITAGDIITNNVRVLSEDGNLILSDETLQISDGTRVRVQIGKDASNDYSINIWDEEGNLMFSKGGITDSAIKDAIIRNDMVSDTANIAAHKLDIDSLFEEINGSSKTIKSTKIYFDDKKQTLDVAFTSLTTDVTDLEKTVTSQGTQITAIQGQISSKIWEQDCVTKDTLETNLNGISTTFDDVFDQLSTVDDKTETLSTKYSSLEQEVDEISTTVANHTTEISKKADGATVTAVSNKVTSLEQNLSGFKTTVSDTYVTKSTFDTNFNGVLGTIDDVYNQITSAESSISQLSDRITSNVTEIDNLGTRMSTVEQTANGLSIKLDNTIKIPDTRNTNETPEWYITNYPQQRVLEFKLTDVIGLSGEMFCTLETVVPWSDTSGGYPKQTVKLGTKELWRVGTSATTWGAWQDSLGTANTARTEAANAAKTATNFLSYDSANGLLIGNKTSGSWNGLRAQILPSAYNILSQNGTVLASYGEKLIELGKNSSEAIISLCGDKGQIEFDSDENYLQIAGDYLRLKGNSGASLYSNYYDNASFGQRSAINVGPDSIYMYSQESTNIDPDTLVGVWTTSTLTFDHTQFNLLTDNIYETSRYGSTYSTVSGNITLDPSGKTHSKATLIVSADEKSSHNDGVEGWYIGSDGTAHATSSDGGSLIAFHYKGSATYTSIIRETASGTISINGIPYATNKFLWSGSYYMSASQTATLSEPISSQANGIVLVFSRYSSGAAQNYHFQTYFIPKAQINRHAGCGHTFLLSTDGSFGLFAAKYLYINNSSIVGNDVNTTTGTGTCGIKYTNDGFVLRYVVGV